jgi:chloramphenicol 3-O phosphotransferase
MSYIPAFPPGKIILLNGASSAGKSTLCRAIQAQIDEPFLQFSLDFFMFGDRVLPSRRDEAGAFSWPELRPKLFDGYFHCLPALARAGNNLVIDYIIETRDQLDTLVQCIGHLDVFFVGVHCPLPELERRERLRGDRGVGDARRDFETVHTFSTYDLDVDSSRPAGDVARQIMAAWKHRTASGVFSRLASGGK